MRAHSLLATDGYKFSMAEAGYPLRRETFYLSHRRGGAQYLPFDGESLVRALLPAPGDDNAYAFLVTQGYDMGAGFKAAMLKASELVITALPQGSWFLPREPWLTITGPSALVSWLEPLLLQLNFRVQVATLGLTAPERLAETLAEVSCDRERDIVLETLDAVGVRAPVVRAAAAAYEERVSTRVRELGEVLGDPARMFEVGLRAATCVEQHGIALVAAKRAGLTRTSHVAGAREHGMLAVGTMGHEHVQRFRDDESAFRAMRDRRPTRSSFLLDTFDTLRCGVPAALRVMSEAPNAGDSVRYDSGDKEAQYRAVHATAKARGLSPIHILEDGFDLEQTRHFESLRKELGILESEQFYGFGGYLVAQTMAHGLTRDRVSAVYKLSQSGPHATMKFGNEPGSGKASLPGRPVVARRVHGTGPLGIVVQEGEALPTGYAHGHSLTPAERILARGDASTAPTPSAATAELIHACRSEREQLLQRSNV